MDGIFGYGIAFDCTMFEEWDRESLIKKILFTSTSDLYTEGALRGCSIDDLKLIYKEMQDD